MNKSIVWVMGFEYLIKIFNGFVCLPYEKDHVKISPLNFSMTSFDLKIIFIRLFIEL